MERTNGAPSSVLHEVGNLRDVEKDANRACVKGGGRLQEA